MKRIIFLGLLSITLLSNVSCDKVTKPYIVQTELDTSLYPGVFYDYVAPEFEPNTNTERNVLIEDFTGHKCAFCPAAAEEAENIAAANPGRVFIAAIHATPSPAGTGVFQDTNATGKYTRNFTTTEGKDIASTLAGGDDFANPTGSVNRTLNASNEIFHQAGTWSATTTNLLTTGLMVNIQAKSNYFPETNGIYIHTETEFLEDMDGEYSIVIYAIQNKIVDWQKVLSADVEDYEHHDVHIGNVFAGESFGRTLTGDEVRKNDKFTNDFSYKIPDGLDGTSMHFLIYVYDKGSNEILQVIKHNF